MTGTATVVLTCAAQEIQLATRSRTTQIFGVVFAALALAVSASGYILSGGSGVQDFARTATSLTELVLFIVPIMALVVGTMALTAEQGSAELLFAQPVARRDVLLGQLLGLLAALVAAQAIGFGGAGLVIFSQSGADGLASFAVLGAASIALTAASLAAAAVIAVTAIGTGRARSRQPSRSGSPRRCCTTSSRLGLHRCSVPGRRRGCSSSPRSSTRSTPFARACCSRFRARQPSVPRRSRCFVSREGPNAPAAW